MQNDTERKNDFSVRSDEILEGMRRHEFQVYYQPQYDALTNRIRGAEALARWVRPDGSVVMPGAFIPELEKSDRIVELDWYVFREVCVFLQRQRAEGMRQVPISVNFSRKHVCEGNFAKRLCEIADAYAAPRELLIVEVTESALVEHEDEVLRLVEDVRRAGFRIAIDDFGSGLSSLSFVKDISSDILKIDKSLLSHNCEDEKERIVLESLFSFAHRLKMVTVAEGVETREQLGFLRTCGCNVIQGFLFAKPMDTERFLTLCRETPVVEAAEDILMIQPSGSAMQLLLDAVFMCYPLVIYSNLTRNSFYMMAYENFSSRSCPSTGVYDELIRHGASTMHPDDQELFRETFRIDKQTEIFARGEKKIRVVTRQMGDDGVYRRVETTNYLVKNPSSDDVLVISLCHNLEE